MKKIMFALLILFLSFSQVFAAGSVSVSGVTSQTNYGTQDTRIMYRSITVSWTGDASTGSVPATSIDNPALYGYVLYSVQTIPSSPAPTSYSVTLVDENSVDLAGGLLASRSTSTSEIVNTGRQTNGYPVFRGAFTFTITGQTTASAKGSAILVFMLPN